MDMTNEEIDEFQASAKKSIEAIEHEGNFLVHEDSPCELAAVTALSICCALLEDKRTR
jgi:hypothetical protein